MFPGSFFMCREFRRHGLLFLKKKVDQKYISIFIDILYATIIWKGVANVSMMKNTSIFPRHWIQADDLGKVVLSWVVCHNLMLILSYQNKKVTAKLTIDQQYDRRRIYKPQGMGSRWHAKEVCQWNSTLMTTLCALHCFLFQGLRFWRRIDRRLPPAGPEGRLPLRDAQVRVWHIILLCTTLFW